MFSIEHTYAHEYNHKNVHSQIESADVTVMIHSDALIINCVCDGGPGAGNTEPNLHKPSKWIEGH